MLTWDTALFAAAAIVAVASLAGLMRRRRDTLVADVRRQIDEHHAAERRAQLEAEQAEEAA